MSDPTNKKQFGRTGKDIFNLVRLKQTGAAIDKSPVPVGIVQTALVTMWQAVLGHTNFSTTDDFFKIGGNSIKAVQLAGRLAKHFSINVELTDIFLNPSITLLELIVQQRLETGVYNPIVALVPRPERLPLSFNQQRLWFIHQLEGSVQYHLPLLFSLTGNVSIDALQQALLKMVDKHQSLRTVVAGDGGEPLQQLLPADNWQLQVLESVPGGITFAGAHIDELVNKPFDLAGDFMIRGHLTRISENEYWLLLVIHHIAADGWSMSVLANELLEGYSAIIQNKPVAEKPLSLQYADYAQWQKMLFDNNYLQPKLDFWKVLLKDTETLTIATDYQRPPVQSSRGDVVDFVIPSQLIQSLKQFSDSQNTTLFNTLLAAFNVLLYYYTGQRDVCVGTVVANRPVAELEKIIGFFANSIPLRNNIKEHQSFEAFLQKVKGSAMEAIKNQDVPFEKIIEAVVLERDISRQPLFQVMFVLQNTPSLPEWKMTDVKLTQVPLHQHTSKFDITFNLSETANGLVGEIEYCTDLFREDTIAQMAAHYINLLGSIATNPGVPIDELNMLSDAQTDKLLHAFNDTKSDITNDRSLIKIFEQQAEEKSESIALIFEEEEITFGGLNKLANQLAHLLKSKGIVSGSMVPVCFNNSIQMMVAIFGVLKAGGAYVPLKPDMPMDRLCFMIGDVKAKVVLADEKYVEKLSGKGDWEVVALTNHFNELAKFDDSNPGVKIEAENPAYVLYTSGSTGQPKGVLIQHGSLLNYLLNSNTNYTGNAEAASGSYIHLAYTFDASVTALFMPLLNGRSVVISSPEYYNAFEDPNFCKHAPYDFLKLTPAHLPLLENAVMANGEMVTNTLVLGGEALFIKYFNYYIQEGISVNVINEYGPTEATVGCSTYHFNTVTKLPGSGEDILIGKPIGNVQLYVMSNGRLAPIGVPGEIYIGGHGLAKEYLNNAELTAVKFIPNPYSTAGKRLYKTGDVGRWLPSGDLQYLGRTDDQLKIRGYRIEPGEIEQAILKHIQVSQATVVPVKAGSSDQLAAYFVADEKIKPGELVTFLSGQLPLYMVPDYWMQVEAFPLTANGKIDKKALPSPNKNNIGKKPFRLPESELQQNILAIWQRLLAQKEISIDDNFFTIGGHSILVMRFVASLRDEVKVELSIKDFFQHPTIAGISILLEQKVIAAKLPQIHAGSRPARLPLSFSQQRLWFINKLHGSVQYHLPIALQLKGQVNITVLEASIRAVIDRHEVLRTIYLEHEGEPYQLIQEASNWKLTIQTNPSYASREALVYYLSTQVNVPFNLAGDYLIRAELIAMHPDEHVLFINLHHIASDGWSVSILKNEIAAYYQHLSNKSKLSLTPLPVQYADYAIWQQNYLKGDVLQNGLDFWTSQLQGVEALQFPTDYKRPAVPGFHGAAAERRISAEVLQGLQAINQQQNTTLFITLLAAFKILLFRYTGQQDICVGTSVANRQLKETENLIGFFVSNIALRSQVKGNDSFAALLSQVKQTTLAAYEYQHIPFEKVVKAVVNERDMTRNPIFQVLFVLQNIPELAHVNLPGIQLTPIKLEQSTAQLDLVFNIKDDGDGLYVSVNYKTELFSRSTIYRLLANFEVLLTRIVNHADTAINELPILTRHEQKLLVEDFNQTAAPELFEQTVVDLFNQQAFQQPKATAIIFKNETLSYGLLRQQSNRLANYLIGKGVKPEHKVPLCFERGPDMMVAIWAVLKAGAAYVPIDPLYPAERIAFVVKDIEASLFLCNSDTLTSANSIADIEIADIDRDQVIIENCDDNFLSLATPGGLAYIIYTSGSTGRPKGVMIDHRSLLHYVVNSKTNYVDVDSLSTGSFIHLSYTFDASVTALFMPLLAGKSVVISSGQGVTVFEEENFVKYAPYDFLKITPAHLTLLKAIETRGPQWFTPKLVIGGEAIFPGQFDYFKDEHIDVEIINEYGPTEATVGSTVYAFSTIRDTDKIKNGIFIGKPIDNATIYIVDEAGNLLPVGAFGEIAIGGAGLSQGYVNLKELTDEKFIQNPFDETGLSKLYKTGDYGRWLADGNIEYAGRKDDQLKIRGYRVELGEIENAILQSGLVKQAVVIAKKDKENNKRLLAYVVCTTKGDIGQVEKYSASVLPEYMKPAFWIEIDFMPLTINGKVDKKALPEPTTHQQNENIETTEFKGTEWHERLVEIWKDLLEVDEVAINDNFFALGGDSLLAVRVIAAIRKKLAVEVKTNAIFYHSTIASLAAYINSANNQEILPTIQLAARPQHIPLSYGQERLWLIDKIEGSVPYHLNTVLDLDGPVNIEALNGAFKKIIERHETLRTIFREEEGGVFQQIKSHIDWQLDTLNIPDFDTNEKETDKQIGLYINTPFGLSKDYMIRAMIISGNTHKHILVITIHHIASDGWSNGIFIKELVESYQAIVNDRKSLLPPLPVQYADYALWQRQWLSGKVLEDKLAFWKKNLQDIAPLNLPPDNKRPAIQSFEGNVLSFNLDKKMLAGLKALSRKNDATLFMTLLAAFKVLMFKYSNQEDIGIGTPVANRPLHEIENLVGFFTNTIVLRSNVNPDSSFDEFLQSVKQTTLQAFQHQDVPFEKVVDVVLQKRDISRSPLFQVMFVLQNEASAGPIFSGDILISPKEFANTTSKYDLSFFVKESHEAIEGFVEFATHLFRAETILTMVAHFRELLVSIIDDPRQKVGNLSLLSTSEEHQLLNEFAGKVFPHPPILLHEQIEAQLLQTPLAVAIKANGHQLTYQELSERSTQLSQYLVQKGAVAGSLVPVLMERTINMVVALLGILKSGAAYVPIDPLYPQERIGYMIAEAGATIAISSNAYKSLLPQNLEVIDMVKDWEIINQQPFSALPATNNNQPELAYVIYTSGSTGHPKGVMISHESAGVFINWCKQEFGDTTFDTVYAGTSISFDLSVFELFYTLSAGKTIRLLQNGLEAPKYLKEDTNVLLNTVPSVIESLLKEQTDLSNVTAINMAGEPVSAYVQLHLDQQKITVRNLYGPSEDTTYSTVYRMHNGQPLLIGKPIHNTTIYILNQQGRLQPVGIAGEICIGGKGLALGYLNQPELTAEKFVPNPFKKGERLYKTGDLGRWTKEGNIDYLGRIDDQVKVRGYRIEPGEIESVLQQSGQVTQVAVLALTNQQGNKYLCAFIVPKAKKTFQQNQLRQYAANRLPDFMVPQSWAQLDSLPLTPNGKTDRKKLASMAPGITTETHQYQAPQSKAEKDLASIWGELLGNQRVGIDDNFFELGGDSILTIQAVSRVNRLGYELQPRDIFLHQTIGRLTKAMAERTATTITAEQGTLTGQAVLLPIQQWYLQHASGNVSHYNQSILLHLHKDVGEDQLLNIVASLTGRHDALRFRYTYIKQKWQQWYSKATGSLLVEDLRNSTDTTADIQKLARQYQSSLNIEKGDLVRMVWIQMPREGQVPPANNQQSTINASGNDQRSTDNAPLCTHQPNRLLIIIHHLAIDGVSWRILLEDMEVMLLAAQQGSDVRLPAKTSSYRQWAQALQQYGQSQQVQQQLPYWQQVQQQAQPLTTDFKYDEVVRQQDIMYHQSTLDAGTTQQLLQQVPRVYHTEINDLLLAALSRTFKQQQNNSKLLIGLEGHGREDIAADIDITRTVGWFTSLYPVLLDSSDASNDDELIQCIKEQLRRVPGKGLGYGILKYLNQEHSLQANDTWEIVFNYLGQLDNATAGSQWFAVATEPSGTNQDGQAAISEKLSINAQVHHGRLTIAWAYSSKHFAPETIEVFAQAYLQNISSLVSHCIKQEKTTGQVYTPSDYGIGHEVSYHDLNKFLQTAHNGQPLRKQIESLYKLSGLQQGMLFHSLYQHYNTAYVQQLSCTLQDLNIEAFSKAWQQVLRHHSILRSAFYANALALPVQVVMKAVTLSVDEQNLTHLSKEQQTAAITAFEKADRKKGFNYHQAPLMRLTLLNTSEGHRMVWTYHHLLIDGWSLPVLMQEFLMAYDDLHNGQEPTIQSITQDKYEDYIRYTEQIDKPAEEAYWRSYLQKVEGPTLLPFISATADRNKTEGDYRSERLNISTEHSAAIHAYTRQNRITVNTLMQGIWSYLLSQYTGNQHVVYGIIVSGRPEAIADIEQRVGLYINTLPLYTQVDYEKNTESWLREIQQGQVNSLPWQHTPLAHIQSQAGVHGQLFDSILVFENYPISQLLTGQQWALKTSDVKVEEQTNYPLTIAIQSANEINITFQYNSNLLPGQYVQAISRHFNEVLAQVINGTEKLGQLNLLSQTEQQGLVQKGKGPITDYPKHKTFGQLFEEQAAKTPNNIALVFHEERYTYKQLNERSNQVALYLRKKGVTAETLVPICLERSAEMIIAMLGIVKAGGAYVPIDPLYPQERIHYMLEDTAAKLVITSVALEDKVTKDNNRVEAVMIDAMQPIINRQASTNLSQVATANNLVYVMYTSGSTGRPKGVMVEHRNLMNFTAHQSKEIGVNEEENILLFSNYAFDASVEQIVLGLTTGAALIVADKATVSDQQLLLSYIEKEKATHLVSTPSFLESLTPGKYGNLKRIVAGGEQCSPALAARWSTYIDFYNAYGPTETTVTIIECKYTAALDNLFPIGRPFANTSVYVVGPGGWLVPEGVSGEIWLGGDSVTRGYLNLSKQTNQKFISDPFSNIPGQRIYKTGDLGRWLADGNLDYLGRMDQQVKIRGFRLELGEIEQTLLQSGLVKQAVVIAASPDEQSVLQLVVYVVTKDEMEITTLKEYLQGRLPEYMVPRRWIRLQQIPLTGNGKANVKALPPPFDEKYDNNEIIYPRTETEASIATIWEQMLGVKSPSLTKNFFELGGHSLLAIRLIAAIRKQFQVEVGIKDVFEYPTIESLAGFIENNSSKPLLPPIEAVRPLPQYIPLSFSQERLWFINKFEGTVQYHIPFVLRLTGRLNIENLEKAFKSVVEKHQVLRTVISEKDGQPFQLVREEDDWQLVVNETVLTDAGVHEFILNEVERPFDLSADYMLRASVIPTAGDEHLLVIVVHHIASDGWSSTIMVKDIFSGYNLANSDIEQTHTANQLQYADYAIWQRNNFTDEFLQPKIDYWKNRLSNIEPLDLPADFKRPALLSAKGAAVKFILDAPLAAGLNNLGNQYGSTLFITLLTAFKVLLSRYSRTSDIIIGTPVANRNQPELDDMIGFFVNTLAIRTKLTNELSFLELLALVKNNVLEAYENQEVPFEKIVENVVHTRDLSRSPIFQVMFALQKQEDVKEATPEGLLIQPEPLLVNNAKYELTLNITDTANGLEGSIEYSTDLFKKDRIERMIIHFVQLLHAIVQNGQTAIIDLPLLGSKEQEVLLYGFNKPIVPLVNEGTIIDRFYQQVRMQPNAIALVYDGVTISYYELNKKATKLAMYLVDKGIAHETPVPVCMFRSINLVVSLLAIMKAGATYVPIDPAYPEHRIKYMLTDIRATLLLTDDAVKALIDQSSLAKSIHGVEIISVSDVINDDKKEQQTVTKLPVVRNQQLAYIIYTSGSTGKPKGVMIGHGSLANLIEWHINQYQVNNSTVSTSLAGVAFDAFGWELWPYLSAGATIHLLSTTFDLTSQHLINYFREHSITHSFLLTALVPDFVALSGVSLPNLQFLLTGGDKLPAIDISSVQYNIVNNYGPTENTVVATSYPLPKNVNETPYIGLPVTNTAVYILDEKLQLVPIGVPGEIYLAGAQLARGYLHNATLTSQKFVNNNIATDKGSKLYKTGDLGRWNAVGNVEFLGRIDDQVKLRGYRIEPGEIENEVLLSGMAKQTVVTLGQNSAGEKRLIGYLVPTEIYDHQQLVTILKQRLPEFMVPLAWVTLEELPLTPNGKIDKTALPAPDENTLLGALYEEPVTAMEKNLAEIWGEHLGIENIGINNNFFELGGHSLMVLRMIATIQKQVGVELAVKDIFEFSTIKELGRFLELKMPANNVNSRSEFDEMVI